jgi:hypothetical protein
MCPVAGHDSKIKILSYILKGKKEKKKKIVKPYVEITRKMKDCMCPVADL